MGVTTITTVATIAETHPHEAEYTVPLAYRTRTLWTMNLRELFHVVELRSTRQGHPSYRRIARRSLVRFIWRPLKSLAASFNCSWTTPSTAASCDSE